MRLGFKRETLRYRRVCWSIRFRVAGATVSVVVRAFGWYGVGVVAGEFRLLSTAIAVFRLVFGARIVAATLDGVIGRDVDAVLVLEPSESSLESLPRSLPAVQFASLVSSFGIPGVSEGMESALQVTSGVIATSLPGVKTRNVSQRWLYAGPR